MKANFRFSAWARLWTLTSLVLALDGCSSGDVASDRSPVARDSQAIIGGSNTSNEAFPWSVRLSHNGKLSCGGSLIAPDWVLTVAHCLMKVPTSGYAVQLGSGELISASEVIPHPDYVNDPTVAQRFDVGLIHLSTPATLSSVVGTVRLALGDDQPGLAATAIGWGMTNHDTDAPALPNQLQEVSLPVVPNSYCNKVLKKRNFLYDEELCAGFPNGFKGVCFGDSGSALIVQRSDGVWEHIGMPSGVSVGQQILFISGEPCDYFAIFTRTSSMISWIRNYVPDSAWFPPLDLVTL